MTMAEDGDDRPVRGEVVVGSVGLADPGRMGRRREKQQRLGVAEPCRGSLNLGVPMRESKRPHCDDDEAGGGNRTTRGRPRV